jgi:hypothetical protein
MIDDHVWKEDTTYLSNGSITVFICENCKQLKTAYVKPCTKKAK